jgi:hypothetical protein
MAGYLIDDSLDEGEKRGWKASACHPVNDNMHGSNSICSNA